MDAFSYRNNATSPPPNVRRWADVFEGFQIGGWRLGLKSYSMAPSGRELSAKLTEGACVKKRFLKILFLNVWKYSYFPHRNRSCRKAPSPAPRELPLGGSLRVRRPFFFSFLSFFLFKKSINFFSFILRACAGYNKDINDMYNNGIIKV